ncbi:MAG: PIN domain-containing protein [Treponema sp.]|jgi:predicted nucleic acid-binding protein|nr:PIN domain-containing protein [Treponema sp.]
MKDNVFIDTNIWVYAHIDDGKEKYTQARIFLGESLREKHIIVSTQILSEFYSAMTKNRVVHSEISKNIIEIMQTVYVAPIGLADIERALTLKEKYGYSWWDSLLLASSLEAECEILYSEDMQDGQVIEETLAIRNPFALAN